MGLVTKNFFNTIVALLLVSSQVVRSDKDDSYYKPGSGNPNVYQKMYWKDSENILADLDQFQYLYVEFQHCAWTWMNYGSGADESSIDENDYWYLGKVPGFGANVAYSLYGSLKGESFKGCNSNSFINSFYTSTGFQDFVYAMTYAGVENFTNNDFSGYSSSCNGYYGVGCDYNYGFVTHKHSGRYCNPTNITGISDTMTTLNAAMESASCVKIYDANSGTNKWNGYNYTIYGTPLELLAYSDACFYQNYWAPDGQCPDPYNKIQFYQKNFNRGISKSQSEDPFVQYANQTTNAHQMTNYGTMMLVLASLILAISYIIRPLKKTCMPDDIPEKTADGDYIAASVPSAMSNPSMGGIESCRSRSYEDGTLAGPVKSSEE
eukprot:Nitzschia sp. Nitz4//scaffold136_size62208//43064//44197//NITZ4_006375-RA/size62208-processed-gene-0.17-mRNA-1//1//CDS//3329535639//3770//frame0